MYLNIKNTFFFFEQTIGISYFIHQSGWSRGYPPNRVLERCQPCYWPRATTVIDLLPDRLGKTSEPRKEKYEHRRHTQVFLVKEKNLPVKKRTAVAQQSKMHWHRLFSDQGFCLHIYIFFFGLPLLLHRIMRTVLRCYCVYFSRSPPSSTTPIPAEHSVSSTYILYARMLYVRLHSTEHLSFQPLRQTETMRSECMDSLDSVGSSPFTPELVDYNFSKHIYIYTL